LEKRKENIFVRSYPPLTISWPTTRGLGEVPTTKNRGVVIQQEVPKVTHDGEA